MEHASYFVRLFRQPVWEPKSLQEIKEELRASNTGFDELELQSHHFNYVDDENDDDDNEYPAWLEAFYDAVQANTSLKEIKINDLKGRNFGEPTGFGPDDFVGLFLSVGYIPCLEELSIFDSLGSAELTAVAAAIRRSRNLKRICLCVQQNSCGINTALREVSDALQDHPSLCNIWFSLDFERDEDNQIANPIERPVALDPIGRACSEMPALEKLTLNCRPETTMQSNAFARLLVSTTIQEIDIDGVVVVESAGGTKWPRDASSLPSRLKHISATDCGSRRERAEADNHLLEGIAHVLSLRSATLETLELSMPGSGLTSIVRALDSNRSLKCLRLSSCTPDGTTMLALLRSRRLLSGLEKLQLSKASYTDEEGRAVAEMVASNAALVEVSPGGSFSSAGLRALANAISSNPSLESLLLRGSGERTAIPEADAISFFDALSTNSQLKKIDLSGNVLTATGLRRLVGSMEAGSGVEELIYSSDRVSRLLPIPADALISANSRLKILKLSLRTYGRELPNRDRWVVNWNALSQGIENNAVLEQLEISGSSLSEHDSTVLSNALSQNTMLKSLHLNDCRIGDSGATVMAENLLRNNRTLEELVLDDNLINGDGAIIAFADALKVNTSLKVLQMKGRSNTDVKIGKSGALALLDMLEVNMTLLWLQLDDTDLDSFYENSTYYLRLNHMKRKEMTMYLSEGAGRDVWVEALIEARKDLDCSSYLLKLNPRAFFGLHHRDDRKRKRENA